MERNTLADNEILLKNGIEDSQCDWPEDEKKSSLRILWEHRELIYSLTFRDIRSRYKQSVLGIAWALLQPLAMTAVFTVVMSFIARVPTGNVPYPIFAYIAMLPWTFFSGGLSSGTDCLVSNFNLITKIYFPREVFPISAVLGKVVDLGLGLLVMIPLIILYHIPITAWAFMVIPALIIQIAFLLGITFIFSSANLFYRDIKHVMPLLLQIWMYLTPIVYGLNSVPERYLPLYMLNPMVSIMDTYRRCVLNSQPPMWNYLGYSAVVSIVVLVLGYLMFKKLEPKFAETI